MLLHRLTSVVRSLEEAGIAVMVLKGPPLACSCYGDAGLRPMRDLDIVVPESRVEEAADMLKQRGWTANYPREERALRPRARGYRHAAAFRNSAGDEIDLHWHVFYLARSSAIDQEMRESAVPVNLQGTPTRTLAPTHHLMLIVVHGCGSDDVVLLRWVADAIQLLRRQPAIDWNWIESFAVKHRLTLPALSGFTYLAEKFAAPVPEQLLHALRRAHPDRFDIAEFERITRPQQLQSVADTIRSMFRVHTRGCEHLPGWRQWLKFPGYLAWYWKVDGGTALARRALAWSSKRVRNLWMQGSPKHSGL
jgi:hypothetical protein